MHDSEFGGSPPQDVRTRHAAATPAVPALLAALRDGTRTVHARLEAMPGMAQLLAPDLTHTQYVSALLGLRAFHAGMQSMLAPFGAQFQPFDLANSLALDALNADLAWYEQAVSGPFDALPAPPDAAAALGALYVLEGSALGGRVIGRAIAASLGVSPGFGGSFFCGVTAEAARRRWLAFSDLLARAELWLDRDAIPDVVDGALSAFACFERVVLPACAAGARAVSPASLGLAAPVIS